MQEVVDMMLSNTCIRIKKYVACYEDLNSGLSEMLPLRHSLLPALLTYRYELEIWKLQNIQIDFLAEV